VNRASLRLAAALLLLAASALLARAMPSPTGDERAGDEGVEPLARALQPLGPVRALVSSALWVQLLHGQMQGDVEAAATLSRALLALHPGLTTVREYLAGQLLVTEAPRAPDRARHDALVDTGLQLFTDGLQLPGGAALHAPFGRTLAVQCMPGVDDRFPAAAEMWLGEPAEDRALTELLASGPRGFDRWLAANLVVQRGLHAWTADGDRAAAERDLALARELLPADDAEAAASGIDTTDASPREIEERAGRLLAPLEEALQLAMPATPAAPATPTAPDAPATPAAPSAPAPDAPSKPATPLAPPKGPR
jgi:hypothetical protein